jgi:hypothetical protein
MLQVQTFEFSLAVLVGLVERLAEESLRDVFDYPAAGFAAMPCLKALAAVRPLLREDSGLRRPHSAGAERE